MLPCVRLRTKAGAIFAARRLLAVRRPADERSRIAPRFRLALPRRKRDEEDHAMTQTVTGLFDTYLDAEYAVQSLERAGVPHRDISIVANNAAGEHDHLRSGDRAGEAGADAGKGAGVGAAVGGLGGLLAGLGLLAIPGLGPVVAAGWLASTVVGAGVGAVVGGVAGGLVGALTHAGVPEDDAHVYAEGVRRGGSLVTARVDDALAPVARSVLTGGRAVDLQTRRQAYVQEGWSRFDETAPNYTPEQVLVERQRYTRV
jgi:hypothetical protein